MSRRDGKGRLTTVPAGLQTVVDVGLGADGDGAEEQAREVGVEVFFQLGGLGCEDCCFGGRG